MAYTDWQLPFTVTRMFDVLQSSSQVGVVIRRQRWPSPVPPRMFRVEYQHIDLDADVVPLIAAIDAAKGAAATFTITLPDVGTVTCRFHDDGYRYRVARGKLRHMIVNLIEEPRVA